MIERAIVDYLALHRRLVVPGLGAFLRKEDGGEVVFSGLLRTDGGEFAAWLEQCNLVSRNEAEAAIADFADHVRRRAASAGSCEIPGLGTLVSGANGALRLDYRPAPANGQMPATGPKPTGPAPEQPAVVRETAAPKPPVERAAAIPAVPAPKKRRVDIVLVVAILAALLAIGSLVYGVIQGDEGVRSLFDPSPVHKTE